MVSNNTKWYRMNVEKINVLHVVNSLKIGGMETFVIDLIRKSSGSVNGHILCLEWLGELGESVNDIPVHSLEKHPGVQVSCIGQIRYIVNKYDIDIIHSHNEGAHFYAVFAGLLSGIPIVHTRHGIHESNNKKKNLLERLSSLLSRKIIGVSQDISNLYIEKIKVPSVKVQTIFNGIDTNTFCHRALSRSSLIPEEIAPVTIVLGIVARLVSVKDHRTLFLACQIVASLYKDFLLLVIGDGPEKDNLTALAKQIDLQDKIIFMGPRYDIGDLLNCLDIFVLSSLSEGMSITLLEAMACELPVVATRVGGNPEVVIHGETGLLVPPEHPEVLAENILLLMNSEELRKNMGMAGRGRVLKKFSIHRSAREYEECYKQVLRRIN